MTPDSHRDCRAADFFDLWAISQTFGFDGAVLVRAIRATFERRGTGFPADAPLGLSDDFAGDASKQAQWRAFLRRAELALAPAPLSQLIPAIRAFLMPLLQAANSSGPPPKYWPRGGPWRD